MYTITKNTKHHFIVCLSIVTYFFLVGGAFITDVKIAVAERKMPFSVTPLIIDEKASRRDLVRRTITITNHAERRLNVYALVNNFDPVGGSQDFVYSGEADLSRSLANWIEITRGAVDLLPGESRDIQVLIQVNLRAEPGTYHAFISFGEGTTRVEAEAAKEKMQSIAINLDVLDDASEHLNLEYFTPEKTFFSGKLAEFSFSLENTGNRSVTPKGEVRIYDRRGVEKATLLVNEDKKTLSPENSKQLSAVWNSASFGRYKALLDLEYGVDGKTIQDTVFFWVIPWKALGGLFGMLTAGSILFILLWYPRYERRYKLRVDEAFAIEPHMSPDAFFTQQEERTMRSETAIHEKSLPKQHHVTANGKIQKPIPPAPREKGRDKGEASHTVTLGKKVPPESHVVRLQKRGKI